MVDDAIWTPGNLETCPGNTSREIELFEIQKIVLAQQANLPQSAGPNELGRTRYVVHAGFTAPVDHDGGLAGRQENAVVVATSDSELAAIFNERAADDSCRRIPFGPSDQSRDAVRLNRGVVIQYEYVFCVC